LNITHAYVSSAANSLYSSAHFRRPILLNDTFMLDGIW